MKRDRLIDIAMLLLLMSLCPGLVSISLLPDNLGPGPDEIFHGIMESIIDPPWLGYALCSGVLLILSLAVFVRAKK